MPAPINLTDASFRILRERRARGLQCELVDKTAFIEELLEDVSSVFLFPRPRRFGKSLNIDMLNEFFAQENLPSEHLFEGLYIKRVWERVAPHFRRYPTVYFSFKELKPTSFESWEGMLRSCLSDLARKYEYVFPKLDASEQNDLRMLIDRTAPPEIMSRTLLLLSAWLERYHSEKVVILIDEYDAPIQMAWVRTQEALKEGLERWPDVIRTENDTLYNRVITFFRTFFEGAFKGNPHLFKGVLTGILRIARESIFSELNNLKVRSMLDNEYASTFGFTEDEVTALFERQDQTARLKDARTWYNGYQFGDQTVYNPWSVMNFLSQPGLPPKPYWLTSSDNALIRHALAEKALVYHEDFQKLLAGEQLEIPVIDAIALPDLTASTEALYSLLLFSGYLKVGLIGVNADGAGRYGVEIPNLEVKQLYLKTFTMWLGSLLPGKNTQSLELLQQAILTGNERLLQSLLGNLALTMMSFYDGSNNEPEAFYHGLLLGLCASLQGKFRVESNREAGMGRAELLIAPLRPGQPGAVLELKVAYEDEKTLDQALEEGVAQLKSRKYAVALEASGASPIQRWAVAFDGKEVRVRRVKEVG